MKTVGLASNFQDEFMNVEPIWNVFKDVVVKWTVVDSGSTDNTQEKLRQVVGDKLNLVESDEIKTRGYGYSRTRLVELTTDVDYVLIIDGDERMTEHDVQKLQALMASDPDEDMIWLPRCHYQDWEMTKVQYGSWGNGPPPCGPDWEEALRMHPDWQPRLIKRTMIDGKSKVSFYRKVHEWVRGIDKESRDLEKHPVIRHFGYMKTAERKKEIANLCRKLSEMDGE